MFQECEEALQEEDDDDVYILSKVSDVLHSLFAAYKEAFYPCFDHLLPYFVRLLGNERAWADHQWSLCIWDDVIEFGGPSSIKYQQYFLEPLMLHISDRQPEVRQAAVYGIGVMGLCGGEPYAQLCSQALPRLIAVIQDPESR